MLVFPTTSAEGLQVCAEIVIIDDSVLEGEHNFTVNISSATPVISHGSPYEAEVVIADNDGTCQLITYKLL